LTLVLLDTNAYLRLAKRIKPMLGVTFGQKGYVITILNDVEDEVRRSSTLQFKYPWFNNPMFAAERLSQTIKLSRGEKAQLQAAASVLHGWVLANAARYTVQGRSPPSPVDCRVLAFGQVRDAIVVTDDLGMHQLAGEFDIAIWHGYELLKKMHSAKAISSDLVRDIYEALGINDDFTAAWRDSRHALFPKIFGPRPKT